MSERSCDIALIVSLVFLAFIGTLIYCALDASRRTK